MEILITNANILYKMILDFLQRIKCSPELLMKCYPDTIEMLRMSDGQGSGNTPTSQESCFAKELEASGFVFLKKGEKPVGMGAYFEYQPNGTQRNIDFILSEIKPEKTISVKVDLKHTTKKTFYWNDGWFEDDVLYLISFVMKKSPKVYIGYGESSCSPEETYAIQRRRELIRELNKDGGKVGFLRLYSRQANQYSCDKFTPEFCDEQFGVVNRRLA